MKGAGRKLIHFVRKYWQHTFPSISISFRLYCDANNAQSCQIFKSNFISKQL